MGKSGGGISLDTKQKDLPKDGTSIMASKHPNTADAFLNSNKNTRIAREALGIELEKHGLALAVDSSSVRHPRTIIMTSEPDDNPKEGDYGLYRTSHSSFNRELSFLKVPGDKSPIPVYVVRRDDVDKTGIDGMSSVEKGTLKPVDLDKEDLPQETRDAITGLAARSALKIGDHANRSDSIPYVDYVNELNDTKRDYDKFNDILKRNGYGNAVRGDFNAQGIAMRRLTRKAGRERGIDSGLYTEFVRKAYGDSHSRPLEEEITNKKNDYSNLVKLADKLSIDLPDEVYYD